MGLIKRRKRRGFRIKNPRPDSWSFRFLRIKIDLPKLTAVAMVIIWIGTGLFFYFIPPKNNLIIGLAFLLLFLNLFIPAFLWLKAWPATLTLSFGLWLILLFQFLSLLNLPLGLTTFVLASLIVLYVLLNRV